MSKIKNKIFNIFILFRSILVLTCTPTYIFKTTFICLYIFKTIFICLYIFKTTCICLYILKTILFHKRYCVGFSLIVECAKPLLRSNFDDLRNFMLILLQKLVQEDSQEKIYGQHAAETAESVRQLVQDKNPDVRASALNLLACLKYIYSPDAVLEGIIGQLKERDVKQI